jgi:UPF0755 protein
MKRVHSIALLILGLAVAISLLGRSQYHSFLEAPLLIGDQGVYLQVAKGATMRSVIAQLDESGSTESGWYWRVLTRLEPVTIRAGEYALKPGLKPRGLLELLSRGDVVRYRFTIIEGWTFRQLLAALEKDSILEQEIAELEDFDRILPSIGAAVQHPEGWFMPETYQYVRGDSDLDILRWAHQSMLRELDAAWKNRQDDLPFKNAGEMLTLASIVEKESALESERADIAGVFVRRLLKGWRLESDPTVIYGLGEAYDGDIKRRDLDSDTPYNTYTRFGLPPTPIALPGKSALFATASPAGGTSMFFVANGSGGHVFSATLDEHNAAVQKMLRRKP